MSILFWVTLMNISKEKYQTSGTDFVLTIYNEYEVSRKCFHTYNIYD